ncbi:MAG: cytoskeletal protein CcmA (bactofilin family) [Bradymonadia bacterium]|jgi:cytoskeletal protein CcmA (bactofilin family)
MARAAKRGANTAATSIQAATRVAGRIEGKGDLDVFGKVEGSIVIDGALLIDVDGRADADVEAAQVEIHGIFTGNAKADRIELFETAIVVGDLRAARVIVADGAKFRGLIDMGESVVAEEAPRAAVRPRVAARAPAPAPKKVRAAPSKPPAKAKTDDDADAES